MNANIIDMHEAQANADYARRQRQEHERVAAFHKWLGEHEHRAAIMEALAYIAELQVLDDLRLAAAGYSPQPLQNVLALHDIIPAAALAPFHRLYGEARH